jgi:predicted nucleic acid-binding protein
MTIGIDTTFLVQHDVREAPFHEWSRAYLAESVLGKGHTPGLCPQVLSEYLHVITDPQRFEHPLSMGEALARTTAWWSLPGMRNVFPSQRTVALFLEWMGMHELLRKRVLDTMLAATYASNGYHCLLTTDRKGFALFEGVSVLAPPEGEGTSRSRA